MDYLKNLIQLILCLVISTIGIYLVIYAASFAGASYEMSHGRMAELVDALDSKARG